MLLYVILAYIILLSALFHAVCLYNAFFALDLCIVIIYANAFCFHDLGYKHIAC